MTNQNLQWEATVTPLPFDQAKCWKVVASAGTGKTHTIEQCIIELIRSGVKPTEIMYLIFNSIPGKEFRQKLALQGIDESEMKWVGTHHAICLKTLGLSGKNVLNIKKWGEEKNMLFTDEHEGWSAILGSLEKKIYESRTDFDPLEERLLLMLQKEEAGRKWSHARYMAHALSMKRVPAEIKYVFVDEAQDSVQVQWDYYEYLRGLDQIKGLMLVGDDKQAISGWKGGRGDLFLSFKADRQVCLGKTYRNAQAILKAANNIAMTIKDRSPLTSESTQPNAGEVHRIHYFEDCIHEILASLKKKEKVMVLCRNGIWANKCKVIMERYGVPVDSETRRGIVETIRAMRVVAAKPLQNVTFSELFNIFSSESLKIKNYWENYARFKRGEYEGVAKAEYALMEYGLPWSGDLSLFGAKPQLEADLAIIRTGKIPRDCWKGVSEAMILEIERSMKMYGDDHVAALATVIHRVKGSECDTVFLVKNITGAVRQNENTDPDDELRVWYTGATRARSKLIFTEVFADRPQVTHLF